MGLQNPLREKLFGEKQIQFTTWGQSWGRKLPGILWTHHYAQSRSFWDGPQVLLLQSCLLRAAYGMAWLPKSRTQSHCDLLHVSEDSPFLPQHCLLSFMPGFTGSEGGECSGAGLLITGLMGAWCTTFAVPCSSSSVQHVGKEAYFTQGRHLQRIECLGGEWLYRNNLYWARYLIYTYNGPTVPEESNHSVKKWCWIITQQICSPVLLWFDFKKVTSVDLSCLIYKTFENPSTSTVYFNRQCICVCLNVYS